VIDRRRTAAAVVALVVPLVALLSGCGVNFDAQTDQPYNPAAGVDDRSGAVYVINALVVSSSDGSGTVVASLVNTDQVNDDSLSGVSGPGLSVQPGGTTTIPAGGMLNLAKQGRVFVRGKNVVPGKFIQMTFSFDRGSQVKLGVPVVSADDPAYSGVPTAGASSSSPSASPSSGASPSAGPSRSKKASPSTSPTP
jgi:hypothetical protein